MSNLVEFNQEQIDLIKKQICPPNTTDIELQFFIAQCKRTGLDPMTRQIYLQERKAKDQKGNWVSKKNIQVSIDGFRVIAQRSGQYAGQVGPLWCGENGEWKEIWIEAQPPKAAKVGVLRHDFKEPLWAVARWDSYVQTTNEGKPTIMWSKMPDLMLAKVAESLALRKAFPNDLGGLYTEDEMAQATPKDVTTKPPQKLSPPVNHAPQAKPIEAPVVVPLENPPPPVDYQDEVPL